jgi:hypothetical protein
LLVTMSVAICPGSASPPTSSTEPVPGETARNQRKTMVVALIAGIV